MSESWEKWGLIKRLLILPLVMYKEWEREIHWERGDGLLRRKEERKKEAYYKFYLSFYLLLFLLLKCFLIILQKKGKRDTNLVWVWKRGRIGMKFCNVHNPSFFIHMLLCFQIKMCSLTKNCEMGYRSLMESNSSKQSVNF